MRLFEKYPENPDTILLRNEYYPRGLSEIDVWNYYQKNKNKILKEIDGSAIMLFISIDNEFIVRRKIQGREIHLTQTNYDEIMTGRTISLAMENPKMSNTIVLDIDVDSSVSENLKKECVEDILNVPFFKTTFEKNFRIITTATSYHVYFYYNKKYSLDYLRQISLKVLTSSLGGRYSIYKNHTYTGINIDLTPMNPRGMRQVPFALCKNGLASIDVTNNLKNFKRKHCVIK